MYTQTISDSRTRSGAGFTLVELLVVLTVIGVVVALLFPVFANARERARQTVCISNLRQIGVAVQMYQADNGGALPVQFYDARDLAPDRRLDTDPLLPYEGSPDIYHCPDAPWHVRGTCGPLGCAWLDYRYRVADLLNSNKGLFPSGIPSRVMRPEPMSVLVFDLGHGNGNNATYLILRANGAVSRVPEASVVLWQYVGGKWGPLPAVPTSSTQPWQVFPDEPWPPQFEK